MILRCLGSSSSGNCYLLETDTEVLILELGVKFRQIKEALKFDLSKVVVALCSHEHGDHSTAVKEALGAGIEVVMSKGTQEKLNIKSHGIWNIRHGQKIKVGSFDIMAFNTIHDCAEPLGFLIKHPDCGIICFITDSMFIENLFPDVTHYLVEANYCDQIVNDRLVVGSIHPAQVHRTRNSHMSIATCKELLAANDLNKVVNIVLIHLSDGNSDAQRFKREVKELTRCNVEIATKGLKMELATTPF